MKQSSAVSLTIVRVALGVFFLFEGINKLGWLSDAGALLDRLQGWLDGAAPIARWYLRSVAIPGAPFFARVVPLAELACGVALILGFSTRLAAALACLMVLNFHVASSALFRYAFLTNGYALPILGPLVGLAVGGGRLPWSVGKG